MGKYVTEFIGTFFLVLTIGCTVLPGRENVIPALAIGAALMVMIYAGGHISGGHYNPAVTLGVWMRGRLGSSELAPYWVAQFAGALLAAFTAKFIAGAPYREALVPQAGPGFVAELLFTFALVWVVLNVATAKSTAGNSYYGLAIGMTVMVGAFAVGAVSGAAFNPAVAIGASTMGMITPSSIWMHIVGDFLGAAVAAIAFRLLNPEDV